MKKLLLLVIVSFTMILITNCSKAQNPKIVILKLDDVTASTDSGKIVSDRWQRVADYIENKKIKAAFGVIGFSLAEDNPEYFEWITDRAARGHIEFWNHGYYNRTKGDTIGEFEGTYEQQLRALQLTDSLAKEKLDLTFTAWGQHWSGINEDTDRALAKVSNIKFTFGKPNSVVHFKGYAFPHNLAMEYPVHNPDFEEFKKAYQGKWKNLESFYLQGHPNSWDDVRWDNFVRIVEFLESENVHFVTPSEFLEMQDKNF